MFACGSVARIVGPFWAVQGFLLGPLAVFGGTGALFVVSLALVWALWAELAPPVDGLGGSGQSSPSASRSISIENYPSPSPFVRLQESAPASKNGHSQQLEPYSPPAS